MDGLRRRVRPGAGDALYERLISQDQVDLIIGPYATPNIVAAQAVAERHGYVLPQHTAVLAPLLTYDCQFPDWSIGPSRTYVPRPVLLDALETLPEPPKRIAFVANTGRLDRLHLPGRRTRRQGGAVEAEEAGYEVVDLQYPPTVSDWALDRRAGPRREPDLRLTTGSGSTRSA